MIKIKDGVSLACLKPQMVIALMSARELFEEYGLALVITSGDDGQHSHTSLHYVGYAVDIRTRDLPPGAARLVADKLGSYLGKQYDVLLERTHIHIEFQPKR